jgi:type I restriction enzyme S subunit
VSDLGYLERLLDGAAVEWVPLGDLAQYSATRISFEQLDESNYVGVDNLSQNRGGRVDSNYVPTSGNLTGYRKGDVLIGNIRPYLRKIWLADRKGGTNGDVLVVRPTNKIVDPRYLYQVLSDENFFEYNIQHSKGAKMPRGSKSQILRYFIPIPCPEDPQKSLPIQGEIVRILGAFTALTAELTAELTARKTQYNHYRNQLLSFEGGEVAHFALGDPKVGVFTRGGGLQKKDFVDRGFPCIHYGQIYTHYGTFADKTKSFVTEDFAKKARKAKSGDLVIATTSENDDDVCKAVAWLGAEDVAVSSDACFYTHNLNPKYVSYFFQTEQFQKQKRVHITGTKVRRVNADDLAKILIPIPFPNNPEKSLAEQARIVAILDKFDTLTTSLAEGLPREIALRKRQYEHYRNLLLGLSDAPKGAKE